MSKLPSNLKHWDFDPTGESPANLIRGEEHFLNANNPENRLITPLYGPIYSATLYDASGVEIPRNYYVLGDKLPEVFGDLQRSIYHSIILKKPLSGLVKIDYHMVGSNFTRISHEVASYLGSKLNDPIGTNWSSVNNKPHMLPVYSHRHHWIDIVNTEVLGSVIEDISKVIDDRVSVNSSNTYRLILDRIKAARDTIVEYKLGDHTSATNPHSTTTTDIGADLAGSEALVADLIFGSTYLSFLLKSEAVSVNWERLSNYLKTYNTHTILSDLNSDTPITWGSELSNGLVIDDLFRLGGGEGAEVGPDNAKLAVGVEGISFNGYGLYSWQEAMEYAKDIEGESIVSVTSSDFGVSGVGSASSPIRLTLNYPLASELSPGFVRLAPRVSLLSDGYGFISSAAKAMRDSISTYTPTSLTVNNIPFVNGELSIGKEDIGLGEVNNTSDVEKPVSKTQLAELDKLANIGHRHNWSEVNWNMPHQSGGGIDTIVNSINSAGAVSTKLAKDFANRVVALENSVDDKANSGDYDNLVTVSGVRMTTTDNKVTVTSGYVYSIRNGEVQELKDINATTDIPNKYLDGYFKLLVYISLLPPHNLTVTINHEEKGDHDILLGVVDKGMVDINIPPIVDFGDDVGLLRHDRDVNPHGLDKPIRELSRVVNHGIVDVAPTTKTYVWVGDDIAEYELPPFARITCNGMMVVSEKTSPIAWRSKEGSGIVYQRSFVCIGGDENRLIDTATTTHDIVLGGKHSNNLLEVIVMRVAHDRLPQLFIETWSRGEVDGTFKYTIDKRVRVPLDLRTQEGYLIPGAPANHYRFYYNDLTNEIRWEVIGRKHILQTGYVGGLISEDRDKFIELLNSPMAGVRANNTGPISVTGSIRRPHHNTPNEVNDYSALVNSYISTRTLETLRRNNKVYKSQIALYGYYDKTDDTLVVDNVDMNFPKGFSNFIANLVPGTINIDRDIDEQDLSFQLSMGGIVNVQDWYMGYSGQVRRREVYRIKLMSPKEYNGVVVSSDLEDGAVVNFLVEVIAFNVLWGISSADWSYLSRHLAVGLTEPEQPEYEPVLLLDGLDSKIIN